MKEDTTKKKLYKVITERTDGCEGKYHYNDDEYVRTENIEAYVEAKRVEIEGKPYWWMDHAKTYGGANNGRPVVKAEEINVIEV